MNEINKQLYLSELIINLLNNRVCFKYLKIKIVFSKVIKSIFIF